jgi:predicted CoA-binding protein
MASGRWPADRGDWGDAELLLVDLPPGTGDVQLSLIQKARPAGAVIVSTPQDLSLIDATRAIDLFGKTGVPVLGSSRIWRAIPARIAARQRPVRQRRRRSRGGARWASPSSAACRCRPACAKPPTPATPARARRAGRDAFAELAAAAQPAGDNRRVKHWAAKESAAMPLTRDEDIAELLTNARTIAMVGASDRPDRPSYGVMKFLQDHGYRVIPVNPQITGEHVHGEFVWRELARSASRSTSSTSSAGRSRRRSGRRGDRGRRQGGVDAARRDQRGSGGAAEAAGLKVVMDRCPKIEIPRLGRAEGHPGLDPTA